MKTISFLVLFLALSLIGCNKEDVNPQKLMADYTTLEGKWNFTGDNVSGEFEIVMFQDQATVKDTGSITIMGRTFLINSMITVENTPPNKFTVNLVDSKTQKMIILRKCTVNESFDEFVTTSYKYTFGGKTIEVLEPLTVTRE